MTRRRHTALAGLVAGVLCSAAPAAAQAAQAARPAPAPAVAAPSAIVVEDTTGAVAHAKGADQRRPIASATKLMTALLTLERAKLSDTLPAARYQPLAVESKLGLRAGEELTVADLLRGLLLESANDAAVTLAEGVGGSRTAFVRDMNERARELRLARTRFVDPIGIGAGNVSSARDLASLTRRLRRHAFFRRTVARAGVVLESGSVPRTVSNRNTLVSRRLVDGVKTGHTARAGWVLVGSGRKGSGRKRRIQVISVVLGAPSEAARNEDTLELLEWGVRRFRVSSPVTEGRQFASVPIRYRRGARLPLVAGGDVRRVVARGQRPRARIVGIPSEVAGPVRRGQRFGTVEVYVGSRRIGRAPLVASAALPEAGVAQAAKSSLTRPLTIGVALLALACSVSLARMGFRRRDRRSRPRREEPGVVA